MKYYLLWIARSAVPGYYYMGNLKWTDTPEQAKAYGSLEDVHEAAAALELPPDQYRVVEAYS